MSVDAARRSACATLLLVLSVASMAAELTGHYTCENLREVASELNLKPGGTFEFR